MYSGNESQGPVPGDTAGVHFLLWPFPGVHFASGASWAHGHRFQRLRHEILHNFISNYSRNGLLEP